MLEIQPSVEYVEHVYDAVNDVWNEVTGTLHPEIHTAYDMVGNPISTTDARENTSYALYDRANRSTVSIAPISPVYDPDTGNVSELHSVSQSIYDLNGNIEKQQTGYVSQALADYDAAKAVAVTITRTHVDNTWDALNRLVSTTDAANITVTNKYDANSNLTAVIDGKNQRTEFEYDGLGRNTVTRHPDNHGKTLEYNALLQTRRVDESGRVTTYGYDLRNRLLTVDYDDNGNDDRIYTYDDAGNILQVDEPGTLADVAYTYDDLNRVITETSVGVIHEYTYDLAGNRIHTHIGDGEGGILKTLLSTYDALNRTSTILEDENGNGQHDIGERLSGYQYDLSGGIRIQTQPNGHEIVKILDALNRAHTISGPDGADDQPFYAYTHGFDLYGNVAKINETYPSQDAQLDARTLINLYDPANRLLTETVQTGNETVTTTYAYDNAHNRTAKTVTLDDGADATVLEQSMYTFTNNLNQIGGYTDAVSGKTVSYAYDLNGNRTNRSEDSTGNTVVDEITVYTYDAENRLLAHEKTEGGVSELHQYVYDYRTRRVLRDESGAGGDRALVIFSGGLSVQEWTVDHQATQPDPAVDTLDVLYVRGSDYGGGIGGVLYTLRDLNEDGFTNNAAFNHYNSRGDVVARMDDGGALMYQAAYEAFGRHGDTPGSQEWGSTADRQHANTKDEDPIGLLNEGFRYRDLETGTFITRDPLGFVDGPNVYTYVVQNPWTSYDPHGLSMISSEEAAEYENQDDVDFENSDSMPESIMDAPGPVYTAPESSASDFYRFGVEKYDIPDFGPLSMEPGFEPDFGALSSGALLTIDSLGKSLAENSGKIRIGDNYKIYGLTSKGGVFYGNQYIKTMPLSTVGTKLSKIAGPVGHVVLAADLGYTMVQEGGFGKDSQIKSGRIAGGSAGMALGLKIGAALGAPFGGIGSVPGAVIGGVVGGVGGGFGGSLIGGEVVEYFQGN